MTCIVGFVNNGKVYIGGDSAGVANYDLTLRADEKVFINGDFIFGFTTSFRMGQLLRYSFVPPKRFPETDIYKYMVTDFIDEVRRCLKAGGYASKNNDVEEGGTFLVGYKGRLFKIEDDYQVGEPIYPFDACGCGESFAIGSMYANYKNKNIVSENKVLSALEAAESFSAGVRRPFKVLSV